MLFYLREEEPITFADTVVSCFHFCIFELLGTAIEDHPDAEKYHKDE